MARYKGVASLLLFHQKPLEVMGDKHRGVKHNSALGVSVFLLVDVLDWAHDVPLPKGAQLLVRLQVHMVLQACFEFPLKKGGIKRA